MEYGGCLHFDPLLLPAIGGYYDSYSKNKIDVDSGRAAIQWILENTVSKRARIKRIWLPVYNCPLVEQRIRRISDLEVCWYNLKDDLFPKISEAELGEEDILLWINYCGVVPGDVIDKVVDLKFKTGCEIILDNIQAYFSKPRMDVINIYSCRKFLGVPDGGHIIGNSIEYRILPTYPTAENYIYLLKAVESGSNKAYEGYQISEKRFSGSNTAYGMPLLTKKVLKILDYNDIIDRRKQNFDRIHRILGGTNRFTSRYSIDKEGYPGMIDIDSYTPSVYPYLTATKRLHERLIDKKVFVSRFWKHILTNDRANAFEKDLAEYLIPLPIDQRYSLDDIEDLGKIVREMEK